MTQSETCKYKPTCKYICPENDKPIECSRYWDNKHLDEIMSDAERCHLIHSSKSDSLPDKLFLKGWRLG